MKSHNLIWLIFFILSFFLINSCAVQTHGYKAISPKVHYTTPEWVELADSLQPTLVWEGEDANIKKYDLIIYTGVLKKFGVEGFGGYSYYTKGRQVYNREGIKGNTHKVEKLLDPNMVYVWAVRGYKGENKEQWSTYDFQKGYIPIKGLANQEGGNLWWSFKTPEK